MRLVSVFAMLAIGACAPTPHLAVAPGVMSSDWGQEKLPLVPVPREQFWHAFGSPELEGLIVAALAANPGLDAARARVDKARAELRIANASRYPTLDANLGGETSRTADQVSPVYTYSGFSGGLSVGYDLDLFGANAATRRASGARYAGLGFDAQAAALVVQALVARTYVQLGAFNDRIALAEQQLAAARNLQRLIDIRVREGAADESEAGLQAVEVEQIVALRTTLAEQRQRALTALALLVGAEPPDFPLPRLTLAALSRPDVDPEQPGMLVVRRPDIRAAEARIAAARGDVDAARRAFLPSLKLTASGLGSAASLLGPIGLTTSAGASLLAPIFQGGRLRGQLEAASAGQRESVALYRQTLLSALGEATDALASTILSEEREASARRAVVSAQRGAQLSEFRYREGESDLAALIEARRNQYRADDLRLTAMQDRLFAAIDLFRATGGAPSVQDGAKPIAVSATSKTSPHLDTRL
ncbi:MAG TPA: efflux transporter outer membrane subunit [Sphingobium sp.]|uniref:efflux transporter outer membrane subunit n=1 Tax=Sphingobium sp. TaxID=1912891 RepID=UPI002ED58FA6